MKKLLLLFISIIAFGCSNDDAPAPTNNDPVGYKANIKHECPGDNQTQTEQFCIDEETYNELADVMATVPGPCREVTFTAKDGNTYLGFLQSVVIDQSGECE